MGKYRFLIKKFDKIKAYLIYLARQMMRETVPFCQYVHEYPCTSHCHVFCAHKQCRPHVILVRIHYLVDRKQCIEIFNKKKKIKTHIILFAVEIVFVFAYRSFIEWDLLLFLDPAVCPICIEIVAASKLWDFRWYEDIAVPDLLAAWDRPLAELSAPLPLVMHLVLDGASALVRNLEDKIKRYILLLRLSGHYLLPWHPGNFVNKTQTRFSNIYNMKYDIWFYFRRQKSYSVDENYYDYSVFIFHFYLFRNLTFNLYKYKFIKRHLL